MKDFSRQTYNFSTISVGQKLTYTSFLFLILLGWFSILIFYVRETGWSFLDLVDYYRGSEAKFLFPKTFYELWEVTHFHLFTIPVIYLILIHLFMMTRVGVGWKIGLLVASFLAMVLDMGAPWLIVYVHSGFAWMKILGRFLLSGTLLLLMFRPLQEMWWAPSFRPRRHHH